MVVAAAVGAAAHRNDPPRFGHLEEVKKSADCGG